MSWLERKIMNKKWLTTRRSFALVLSLGMMWLGASVSLVHAAQPEPLVQVQDAWIRQAVKGQSGTGGFMRLTSARPLTLVGFRTPVAGSAELHEMSMEGDVMRMHAIDALPLPAGQAVALQPGGHHLMLMGLKKALPVGTQVPVTLLLRAAGDGKKGKLLKQVVQVPVLGSAPSGEPAH